MTTIPDIPDDDYAEDDDFAGDIITYGDKLYDDISACVKQFLADYFGEHMYNLRSEVYREVNAIIREEVDLGVDDIPDILYQHRTIADEELRDKMYDQYEVTDRTFPWPKRDQWYDKEYVNDDDGFLYDIPEEELTEEQKAAKLIYDSADNALNFHIGFSKFMKAGCHILIPTMQTLIENTASFDLTILSAEGFERLQECLEFIADGIFDRLYVIILEGAN